jgi:uncharacterized phiE125 gp8 family phage protein
MEHRPPDERTLTLITPPTAEPINPDQAKLWLRVDGDEELDTIGGLITAARETLDGVNGYLGRALMTQTWRLTLDRFPADRSISLPLPPLQSVTSVKYLDQTGAQQTFSAESYRISADDWSGKLVLNSGSWWPQSNCGAGAVEIDFVAGWPEKIPEALRFEILGMIGIWFDDRTKVGQLPDGWCSAYRVWSF